MVSQHGYKIDLDWSKGIEKIYEFLISHSEEYFKIKNAPYLTFHIEPLNTAKKLYVAVYNDFSIFDVAKYFSNLDYDNIEKTDLSYATAFIEKADNNIEEEVIYLYGKPVLSRNEIRYLMLDMSNLKNLLNRILNELTCQVMKTQYVYSQIRYCSEFDMFTFIATKDSELIYEDAESNKLNLLNITSKLTGKFL